MPADRAAAESELDLRRPGRARGPAAIGGRGCGRPLPAGGREDNRRHRRSRAHGRGDRAPGRDHHRNAANRDRARGRRAQRERARRAARFLRGAGCRAQQSRDKLHLVDALRDAGPHGGDDRRRGERLARPAPRGHRRRDGGQRNRGRARGGDDGAHRRQLRLDRRRDRGGKGRLREHSQVHHLHLRPRDPGDRSVPDLRALGRRDPAARSPPCRSWRSTSAPRRSPRWLSGASPPSPGSSIDRPASAARGSSIAGSSRAPGCGSASSRRPWSRAGSSSSCSTPAGHRATRPARAAPCMPTTSPRRR